MSGNRKGNVPGPGSLSARAAASTQLLIDDKSRRAAVYALVILAVPIVPFLERLSGAFFSDMAAAFLAAVASSLIVALMLMPPLSVLLFSRARLAGDDLPLARWAQSAYQATLAQLREQYRLGYRMFIWNMTAKGGLQ
jgi:Cu/Ag efflux pump CusA